MALHFNYKDCAGPSAHPADPDQMHPVLHTIIMHTMIVDIGRLDSDVNVAEYAFRIGLYQKFFGPLLEWRSGSEPVKAYITLADVQQYKGLGCNVTNTTRAAWMKRFAKMIEREHTVSNTLVDISRPDHKMSAVDIVQWMTDYRWGHTIHCSETENDGFKARKTAKGDVYVTHRNHETSVTLTGAAAEELVKELTACDAANVRDAICERYFDAANDDAATQKHAAQVAG